MAGTFPLLLDLDKDIPFQTLVALSRLPGIAKIHLDFDAFDKKLTRSKTLALTDQSNGNGAEHRAPRRGGLGAKNDGFSPSAAVLDLIANAGRPMHRKEIKAAGGDEHGERMVNVIAMLFNKERIKKTAPATYTLTATELRNRARGATEPSETNAMGGGAASGADLILKALANAGGQITKKQLGPIFIANKRSDKSIGDQLAKLLIAKKIKRVKGPGIPKGSYELA